MHVALFYTFYLNHVERKTALTEVNSKSSAKLIPICYVIVCDHRLRYVYSLKEKSEREIESGKLGKHPLWFNDRVEVSR